MLASIHTISVGDPGVEQTLRQMRRLVLESAQDPLVIGWAQDVVRFLPERDPDAAANAFLRWVRANVRYTEDPVSVEVVKTPEAMLGELSAKGRATGDCVATVPVPVERISGGGGVGVAVGSVAYLHEMAENSDGIGSVLNHSDSFSPMSRTIAKGPKKVISITTRRGGTLVVTPEHLVRSGGAWVEAGSLGVGDQLDRIAPRKFSVPDGCAQDEELAWAHGMISSDGTLGAYDYRRGLRADGAERPPRFAWRVSNNDVGLLLRLKSILEKNNPSVRFEIQQYDSERPGSPTRYHTTKHISHLVVRAGERGSRNEFIRGMIRMHLHGDQKIIPSAMFGSKASMRGWLDGYSAGDGLHGKLPKNLKYELTVGDVLISAAMPVLLDALGEEYCFAPDSGSLKCRVYAQIDGSRRFRRKLDEVVCVRDAGEMPVYDVVADGEFVAGVFKVHNCDDQVTLLAAGLNAVGVNTEFVVVAADPNFPDYSHVLVQYESPRRGWTTLDPIVRGTGPGWFPPTHSRAGVYRDGRIRGMGLGSSKAGAGVGFAIVVGVAAFVILRRRRR